MLAKHNCILVDDEPKMLELLSDYLHDLYPSIHIADKCTDWKNAFNKLKTSEYDILFLDISMPEKTGFDLLELLPKLNSEIIFVTAHTEFALDAFNFDVCGYVLKPITEKSLIKAVDRAINHINGKQTAQQHKKGKIGIPDDDGIQFIEIDDIIYCETHNRYTRVVTEDKMILSSYNIGKFKDTLPSNIFFQVHRSFIVNINHIDRYHTDGHIVTNNNKTIPISKSAKSEFLALFNRIKK